MKTSNHLLRRLTAALLAAVLALSIALPVFASDDGDTIYINSVSDLLSLARNCAYDQWSVGKTVILQKDLSLEGMLWEPIPSFSGQFKGSGHTISDLTITGQYSPAGLFGIVEEQGSIESLSVRGVVSVSDSADTTTGGIVGINHGTLISCQFTGVVTGDSEVGGIVGPETFRTYERMQKEHPDNLKVVTWEGKGFNYSALNNFGEKFATGEYLLLLNNDTEVITAAWLEEMVMYAQQKRVGCVGAKLLYPDDTIQHAGVGFGIGGVAGHLHKYYPASSDGYMGRLNYVQDVYADTAACLLIRKEIYDEVGGLDESYAVAFNDVDFCVRVRQAGYTNVFTPFAQLYHYESKSRGMEDNPEKQKRFQGEVLRFQARWGDLLAAGDPCTNPNFDIQREDFSLKILPLE